MKERPILFTGPMVRALLDGSKMQTRRAVKPQPQMVTDKRTAPWEGDPAVLLQLMLQSGKPCPYGQPGDQLWVRETFAPVGDFRGIDPGTGALGDRAFFSADHPHGVDHDDGTPLKWKPSIFMPRSLCRIRLEITGVRVERLNDISETDAKAEGITPHEVRQITLFGASADERSAIFRRAAVQPYRALWETINGAGSWAANPWVWVISFKRNLA
jgi:hypothetical protein